MARWRLWNLAATEGVQCTSNLEYHINDRTFGLESRLLDAPDVEVSEEGVKKLGKLRLIVILRLRDPKLEAYEKGIKGRTEINSHLCIESRQQPGQWQWWKMQPCLGLKSQWRPPLQDYQNNFLLLLNRVNLPVTFSRIQLHVCLVRVELQQTCKAAISATETERGRFESPSRRLLKVVKYGLKRSTGFLHFWCSWPPIIL